MIVQRVLKRLPGEGPANAAANGNHEPVVMVTSDVLNDRKRRLKRAHEREVESMSKQSTRHRTRQEQRREEQRRREEERRRAVRTRRITTFITIGVIALVVAGLVYLVVARSQTPANAAYPVVDNVSCQSTEQGGTHIHAHVTVYINGTKTPIPANVGIAPDSSCLYWLHTHDDTGVIHIEAPEGVSATFGNFLDIWGQRFQQLGYPSQLSDATGWQVYVNGKLFSGNFRTIPLQSHTLITLAYHSLGIQPDTTYTWNGL